LSYGRYVVNAAGCVECHTKVDKGKIIPDLGFSGGREFYFSDGSVVRSANITPDLQTGIGGWTKQLFIAKFKAFADSNYRSPKESRGQFNTIMPWMMYSRMSEEDLAAIYLFLRSLKPIQNSVVKFTSSRK
jgi:hypothetical protein